MQTVFKVDIPKRADQAEEKPFIPRRVHRKSRGGCLACKKRRIKVLAPQSRLPIWCPSYTFLNSTYSAMRQNHNVANAPRRIQNAYTLLHLRGVRRRHCSSMSAVPNRRQTCTLCPSIWLRQTWTVYWTSPPI
jgi:hypothetical protein